MDSADFDVIDEGVVQHSEEEADTGSSSSSEDEAPAPPPPPPVPSSVPSAARPPSPASPPQDAGVLVAPRPTALTASSSSSSSRNLLTREEVLSCVFNLGSAIQSTNQNLNSVIELSHTLVKECTTIKETVRKHAEQQEEHTRKIDDIATQLTELQRGQRQVSAVKKSRELRLILEFIVNYGMDSVNGVVVAFPVEVNNTLCLVVNVVLLHAAMTALCKSQVSGTSWRRKEVHLLLSKLDIVDFRKQASTRGTYYDALQRLFAVNHGGKTKVYDNYVAIEADHFFHAVATAKKSSSQLPVRVERDVKAHLFAASLRKVTSIESAKYDEEDGAQPMLDTKMAWGHEVQREVLCQPAVRRFFKRMYELAEQSGERGFTGGDLVVPATVWEQSSFHFFGLAPIFSNPGRPRMSLVTTGESSSSSGSSSEGEDGEDEDDGDEDFEHTVPPSRGGGKPVAYFQQPGFGTPATAPKAPRAASAEAGAPPAKRSRK